VKGFASPLNVTVKVEYSPYNLATKTYGPYVNLTDSGGSNAANADDYVRVTASVANKSTTGALGVFFNRTIEKEVIMRREKTS
jgi:hypothetical protein